MSLSGQFGDKEKKSDKQVIIEKFHKLFPLEHIKIILTEFDADFYNQIKQLDEKNPGKLDHKKYVNFLYEVVGSNFLVNSNIGKQEKSAPIGNREWFLGALIIREMKQNKYLLDNVIDIFKKKQWKPQEVGKCKHCKKSWNIDKKEYRLKFSKKNIIKCIDVDCYTQQLHDAGLTDYNGSDNEQKKKWKKKLVKFFGLLTPSHRYDYEEIAICLGLPASCAAAMPGSQRPEKVTVRPIENLNPLYDFQNEISGKIKEMLQVYNPDKAKAIVALPTGSGKTRLVVETIADWINLGRPGKDQNKRFILWVVERQELCWQAYNEFQNVFTNKGKSSSPLELYPYWGTAGKNMRDILDNSEGDVVIVASKDSLDKKAINENRATIKELGKRCSIVILDEAHRATAPGYIRLLNALGFRKNQQHPEQTILLGLTATPFRGKKTSDLEQRFGNRILWPTLAGEAGSNQKPIPILEVQEEAVENQIVRIYGERSFDKDGTIAEYYWKILRIPEEMQEAADDHLISFVDQFGNQELSTEFKELYKRAGESSNFILDSETSKYEKLKKEKNIEFKFPEPGFYLIALEVSDDEGIRSQLPISHYIRILETPVENSGNNPQQMQKLYRRLMEKRILSKVQHRILGYTGREYEDAIISETEYEDLTEDNIRVIGEDPDRNNMIIEELRNLVIEDKKKSILFFGCSIAHSRAIAITLNSLYSDEGIVAEHVSGETSSKRRNEIVNKFKEQKINVLCNYGLFTTGFDVPKIDCIFIGRPTYSLLLYTQMIGRGLRGPKNKGTPDCLVIDTDDQIQYYKVVKDTDIDDLDGEELISPDNEKLDQAWRIFDELWDTDEKKYWYDEKFHHTPPPPDSIKIKKVNLQKSITSSKNVWKCKTCHVKGSTKNKTDRSFTSRIFGTNSKNITNDNPDGFNHKCLNCREKEQRDMAEGLRYINILQKDGTLLSHQINRLGEFFEKFPEQIKKWSKAFEYVSKKLEEKRRKQREDAKKQDANDASFTFYDPENKDD